MSGMDNRTGQVGNIKDGMWEIEIFIRGAPWLHPSTQGERRIMLFNMALVVIDIVVDIWMDANREL